MTATIRTVWTVTARGAEPRTVTGPIGIDVDARLVDLAELPARLRGERGGWLACLVRHGNRCYLVRGPASPAARDVRRNGAPIVGGIAPVRHGDWIAVAAGEDPGSHRLRRRLWLSAEGPMAVQAATAADSHDTLTLDAIAPGDVVVRCGCDAVYGIDTWLQRRRCLACGYTEDGVYRELPPGTSRSGGMP